jgi:hypothetical protein
MVLVYGLLDFAGILRPVSWLAAWVVMIVVWIGSYAVTARRYR